MALDEFCKNVLGDVLGKPKPANTLGTSGDKVNALLKECKPIYDAFLGPANGKQYRKETARQAMKEDITFFCSACFKPEDDSYKASQGKMLICTPCRALNREVRHYLLWLQSNLTASRFATAQSNANGKCGQHINWNAEKLSVSIEVLVALSDRG